MSAIALAVQECGSGYPILCLHGHPGSAAAMGVFTERLASRYRAIAPDLRGYGHSLVRRPFTMADHLHDLEALLARLEIQECVILGWSLGGILALELALRDPSRYAGLILIGTAARPRGAHPPIRKRDLAYTAIAAVLNQLRPGWQWNIETFGARSLFRHLVQTQTPATYHHIARYAIAAYRRTSPHAHRALRGAIAQGYNRLPDVARLTIPCLMLAGDRDVHITAAASHETAQHLPQCEWHCFPHTAHLFPWEIPEQVNTRIEQWLINLGV